MILGQTLLTSPEIKKGNYKLKSKHICQTSQIFAEEYGINQLLEIRLLYNLQLMKMLLQLAKYLKLNKNGFYCRQRACQKVSKAHETN